MKKEIFRKVALDRLSSPEQIDYLIETTGARAWISLLALCFILAAATAWGFLGQLDTTAPGQGAIVRHGGLYNVVTTAPGRVRDLRVQVGDIVKAEQIIARVSQPALEDKLKAAHEELLGAQKALQRSPGSARKSGGRESGDRKPTARVPGASDSKRQRSDQTGQRSDSGR